MLSVQHPPYSPVSASSIPSGGLYQPSPDYDKVAAAMMHQSPTASQGRPSTSRFDSHDDFYDFLDSNRMGDGRPLPMPSAPGSASGNMGGRPPSSSSSHHQQQHQQQQGPPPQRLVDQPRPPVTRGGAGPGGPGGGQPQARSRAPSYGSGSRSEEMLVDKHRRQNSGRPGTASKGAQTQATPNGPRSPSMSGDRSSSYQNMNGRAPSPGSDHSPAAAGNAIQRLKSPTVVDHVLQPLEKKVNEYAALMDSEEDSVSQLDVEIAMLQERRSQAEARFMDAKNKHDEYRRQYADVERALRGEAPPMPTQSTREMAMRQASAQPPQQQQQPPPSMNGPPMGRPSMHHDDDLDDLDDDEEFLDDQRRPTSRRITSQQSFGRSSQGGKKGRFRFSLFGGEK